MRWSNRGRELPRANDRYSGVTTTSKTLIVFLLMLAGTVGWRLRPALAEPDDCPDGVCRPPQNLSGSFTVDRLPKIDQAAPVDFQTATFAMG